MKRVAQLFSELDSTTSTHTKVDALVRYFEKASDGDKLWMIALLTNHRPPRAVNSKLLGLWATEMAELPEWLYDESYQVTGDHAETAALIVPITYGEERTFRSLSEYMQLLMELKTKPDAEKKEIIKQVWRELGRNERFIFNKLVTGGLRIGTPQKLLVGALAKFTNLHESMIAVRLMSAWDPKTTDFKSLIVEPMHDDNLSRPYPFHLAHTLETHSEDLGDIKDWIVEHKWGGIRGQLIVREHKLFIWTRAEELVTDRFPELHVLVDILPSGTVLDGQIQATHKDIPLPKHELKKRMARKNITRKLLDEIPARMLIFDIIEWEGNDIRSRPQYERRLLLESFFENHIAEVLTLSEVLKANSWSTLNVHRRAARALYAEGLMLKHRNASYASGRQRGLWWKWQADPHSVHCVLAYAQRAQGRNGNTLTELTFAVRDKDQFVPFAKASSGLTEEELKELAEWVSTNTTERFGPVSIVSPKHVFELHFDGIVTAARRKSGITVISARIHEWRKDKSIADVHTLDDLKRLIRR